MKKEITGYPSIDRPWLKYYSEEAIQAELPECTILQYIKNKSNYSAPRLGYINFWSKQRKYNFCFIIALLRKVDNFSM